MLKTTEVKSLLARLGYYDGPIDGELTEDYRADLKVFQRDVGTTVDGWYGAKTEAKLVLLARAIPAGSTCTYRRWRLTYYYIGSENGKPGQRTIPMCDPEGNVLSTVTPGAFVEAALEGTTRLRDGRLLNVATGPSYRKCDARTFAPVFALAKRQGWIPDKAGYAGIRTDGRQATHARTFSVRKGGPAGFPVEHGVELDPYRTLATDVGVLAKHDMAWKGKGGVIPRGTRVFILEFVGARLPDGSIHDGWFTACDTGGGIYGAHADVFIGYKAFIKKLGVPSLGHIWFEGIEDKISMNYHYGL